MKIEKEIKIISREKIESRFLIRSLYKVKSKKLNNSNQSIFFNYRTDQYFLAMMNFNSSTSSISSTNSPGSTLSPIVISILFSAKTNK